MRPPQGAGLPGDERALISAALDDTLVVEAAAGTGKTTELVKRIRRVVETGRAAHIGQIVAVTFSEKAAGELKLRLREELENARLDAEAGSQEAGRLERAVQRFEEAHVSTIHGFCADLLRERPVEACVDPAFEVLTEGQAERLFDEAFADWIQAELDHTSEGVRRSLRRPRVAWSNEEDEGPLERLRRAGLQLLQWRDHARHWRRPDGFDRERRIDQLIDLLREFADRSGSPINRGDALYRKTDELRRAYADIADARARGHADYDGWEARLCTLAANEAKLREGPVTGLQYGPAATRQEVIDARDALLDALVDFRRAADADLAALVHQALQQAVLGYETRKARAGVLDFLDLLMRARTLVREVPAVRRDFQARFRFLLVDEFQDTDPLQADLLCMIAADEPPAFSGDPLTLPIRPGALFLVGDPKQSIYRFRRADVGLYHDIRDRLLAGGATPVTLSLSFRGVPSLQRAVNAAFAPCMARDAESLQAAYVPLRPSRGDLPDQPAVVALPVPRPYGASRVTLGAIAGSLPEAVGEFVRWLVEDSDWKTAGDDRTPRRIRAGDVCLLFRRFIEYRDDVTRPYVEALEARGLTHLLVGGKAYHAREEVDVVRTALMAVEWPDDSLSVFATLRGPLFALEEEKLLAWHALGHGFHPYRSPDQVPADLADVAGALATLRELNRLRNHRPVAETIGRLLETTRAHATFVLWRGGEQVLANVLQIAEFARQYEAEGGLSFRGFVDELRADAARAEAPEAPIVEEGTDGVRLMTVHKAKGLEFPVVILADIGCKLSRDEAQRYLDSRRELCALKLAGWAPQDLLDHNDVEAARDRAEGVRLAYVAATRARDLLVVPAIGDGPFERSWVHPLAGAIYPPVEVRHEPAAAAGVPAFAGIDTVLERPDYMTAGRETMRPGVYTLTDPTSGEPYAVAWWDPAALDRQVEERRGLRREDLIARDARPEDVAADRARYEAWRQSRADAIARGARPSSRIVTATEWAAAGAEAGDAAEAGGAQSGAAAARVTIEDARAPGPRAVRVSGRRFGTLVHALLAAVPLEAAAEDVGALAVAYARLFGATDAERAAAESAAAHALAHPVVAAARDARQAGRIVRREAPVSIVTGDVLVDGQVDLAYEAADGWVVVDFKTDADVAGAEERYRRQVALYVDAIERATGAAGRGVLLRV